MKKIFPIFLLFLTYTTYGQLCTGSKGLPVFFENFGSGTTQGPAFAPGTTTYAYDVGMPNDGEYNLHYLTNINGAAARWHRSEDHTPDTEPDGFEGKSAIFNAGFTPGEFYRKAVSGLCVNTTFEFSAWIMNVLDLDLSSCGAGNPVNVTFEIWNAAETVLIASSTTGPIPTTSTPVWTQYAITFTMPPGQTDVVLKMRNNGVGGCGNDLALDDISFVACGDPVHITSPPLPGNTYTSICQNNIPVNLTLLATPQTPAMPHVYQWQQSTDNVTWTDIAGATGQTYNTGNIINIHYYRTRSSEDIANINNITCTVLSDVFTINFLPKPDAPISNGDESICSNEPITPLSVTVPAGVNVNWYSAASGGTLIASNTTSFTPPSAGTYYAEAYTASSCPSTTRTAVMLTIKAGIVLGNDQNIHLCAGDTTILDAGVSGTGITYLWQPGGEITQTITVSGTGTYMVTATTADGCSDSMTFNVFSHQIPIISDVVIDGTTITVITQGDTFYEYSLDGIHYQNSNMFFNVRGGIHTAYVRDIGLCGSDEFEFLLIVFPKFFTPNNDNYHDMWEVEGMEYIPEGRAAIFDRYGKLITVLTISHPKWDGTYNERELPSTDYWYMATLRDGKEFRGHFSLKR